jgi:16S rRNA (uracil1498-N3)-methyltransferase
MNKHTFRYLIAQEPVPGARITLSRADTHHLTRVVRRRVGDELEVIDLAGEIWPATVIEDGTDAVVELASAPRVRARLAPITLYQGLCEWGRLDMVVEKCAELGVARVVIFAASRSRRVPDEGAWRRRRERFVRVAESAARQSGQGRLPQIDGVLRIEEVLEAIEVGPCVLLDPTGEVALARGLAEAARWDQLALVVGPDSGFAEAEVAAARASGVQVCHLGDTTLRAETAAIVGVSMALAATGHLERQSKAVSTDGDPGV